jgi:hypothetical protein
MYLALRQADEAGPAALFVVMPERKSGLWTAISDRLTRATLPLAESPFG